MAAAAAAAADTMACRDVDHAARPSARPPCPLFPGLPSQTWAICPPPGGHLPPDLTLGLLGSRVVSVLDSGVEGPGFKLQPRRSRVFGKLFTPILPLFTKQQNW